MNIKVHEMQNLTDKSNLQKDLNSDLIYHEQFERYFNCTKPQNQNL